MQEITRRLARYVVESRFDSLPEACGTKVRAHS